MFNLNNFSIIALVQYFTIQLLYSVDGDGGICLEYFVFDSVLHGKCACSSLIQLILCAHFVPTLFGALYLLISLLLFNIDLAYLYDIIALEKITN